MGTLLLGALSFILYLAALAVYRLWLSPLAGIPGPKIAALTSWYNGYHDIIRGGQYVWVIEDMHKKYGPVVRTRPDAVHVNDPYFIEELYSQSPKRRRERFHTIIKTLLAPGSILSTQDHDLHRHRRAALNPYFSRQNVRRLEPVINGTLENLFRRMSGWAKDGQPVRMNVAFRAATKDVIVEYAFGGGEKCLDMSDCNGAFFDVMAPQRLTHLGTHVYWFFKLMAGLPPAIMTVLVPKVGVFARFMQGLTAQIDDIKAAKEIPEGKTIFHDILLNENLPASEKETNRLADEAMVIVIAGSETTATTLAAIMYHMLSDRSAMDRLRSELQTVMPTANELPDASKLEGLPYLNAVINEAIRLYPGASHRQDRLCPDEDLVYNNTSTGKSYRIPAGNGIGMTAPLVNRSPLIYQRPDEFLPDRHIEDPRLSKYSLSFSRGARQCIGINLAYQELQTFVAGIFRRYDLYDPERTEQTGPTLELYKTDRRDIAMHADYVTPGQYEGSEGLRVIIRE